MSKTVRFTLSVFATAVALFVGAGLIQAQAAVPVPSSRPAKEIAASVDLEKWRRVKDLEFAKKALDPTYGVRDWVQELHGFPKVCAYVQRLRDIESALSMIEGEEPPYVLPVFTWPELGGIAPEGARNFRRAVALDVARGLFEILQTPRAQRRAFKECRLGDASFSFLDGMTLVERIEEALDSVGTRPEEIGTSAADIREHLLEDVQEAVRELMSRLPESRDAAGVTAYILERAKQEWSFSLKDLGLSDDIFELLR